jgi:hypothetical protein
MAITAGSSLNSVPAPTQQALQSNYLDLASTAGQGWAQQYLPDLMEQEAEVFGNRTISGFLASVGAEESMTADQVVWSEQGRLHLSYKGHIANGANQITGTNNGFTFEIDTDIDGNSVGTSSIDHGVRVNDMVLVADSSTTVKGIVTEISNDQVAVALYDAGNTTATGANAGLATGSGDTATLLVIGSEYRKGDNYQNSETRQANEPQFTSFSNKPIIIKDFYQVSGSDASRVGWVEIASETGAAGYMWFLKAEADTRARFVDYLEMTMLEAIKGDTDQSTVDAYLGDTSTDNFGTQGLFDAIETRGNITTGVTGTSSPADLAEFDAILAEFDAQGAIPENMMFVNRATSLAMDDMLASMNSYGAGGTSYGVFDNSEQMALNLGFAGFRRGSYDFYKSDFRYLNDKSTRGGINSRDTVNAIRGVFIPAGVSSVYDQGMGMNMKRPFLHVRYRASQTDDRRMKTWVTGSVGAATSALDAMQIHMLSERCLITQGANNFMLMK